MKQQPTESNRNHPVPHPEPVQMLNATQLKTLALIAMLIDHIAWAFVPTQSVQGQIMHAIGRLTFPIMAFFLVEGYFHTRHFWCYLGRMAGFALASHFAFQYFQFGRIPLLSPQPQDTFLTFTQTGILYPFTLGLLALYLMLNWKGSDLVKYSLILILILLATPGDYMFFGPVLILLFGHYYPDRTAQLRNGFLIIGFLVIMTLQVDWQESFFMIATFLPLLLLRYYNGSQGAARHPLIKYGFYLFYPLHLFILGYLRYAVFQLPPLAQF
ncbi:conjugal transfer protein TraX [Clostridiaceae bacterium HFYG-1003]|nr:conjugal transfer protein TraX [Clostridiaceae bacterium HFYG-1003]